MKRFKLLFLSLTLLFITVFNIPIFANDVMFVDYNCPSLTEFQIDKYKRKMWDISKNIDNKSFIAFFSTKRDNTIYISQNFSFVTVGKRTANGDCSMLQINMSNVYAISQNKISNLSKLSGYFGCINDSTGDACSLALDEYPYIYPINILALDKDYTAKPQYEGTALSINLNKVDMWHCVEKPLEDPNLEPLPTLDPSKPIQPRPTIVPVPSPNVVGGSDLSNSSINDLDVFVRPYIKFLGANGGYIAGGLVDDVLITPDKFLTDRTACQIDSNKNYTCTSSNQDWVIKWPNFPKQNIVLNAIYEVGFDFYFNKYVSGTLEFDFSCGGVNGSIHYTIPLKDVTSYKFVFENSIDGKLLNTDFTDDTVQNNYPNIKNMTITNLVASEGLIVQDNQLNNTIENGNAHSNSSNDKLQGSNTDLDNVITDYDKYDKQFNDDLTSSLKNIDFNKFKLDGSGLKNSSAFIRTHFNKISSDNGNPLGLVLGFSMIVGLAVLFIGKKL